MNRPGDPFSQEIKTIIRSIPSGRVASYGQIAAMAGNNRGARQVVRILHTCSKKDDLPWFRVVNKKGKISLAPGQGFEEQKALLESEGVAFDETDTIDMDRYLWCPPEHGIAGFKR